LQRLSVDPHGMPLAPYLPDHAISEIKKGGKYEEKKNRYRSFTIREHRLGYKFASGANHSGWVH
jgi:hypothetical protein